MSGDQAKAPVAGVRRVEPVAGQAGALAAGMVAVAIALLLADEVFLRPAAAFYALGQLQLLGIVAAVAQPRLAVVPADARLHGDVAGVVVQAVARVVRTANHTYTLDQNGREPCREREQKGEF